MLDAGFVDLLATPSPKDGDMESRWSCSPLATGDETCSAEFSLNYYRYVRQIKLGGSFLTCLIPAKVSIVS